mgnify:CR=1 FL=1
MSNHEIIGQALTLMREPLSGYILQQLLSIPEYKVNDAWWQEGVLSNMSSFMGNLSNSTAAMSVLIS